MHFCFGAVFQPCNRRVVLKDIIQLIACCKPLFEGSIPLYHRWYAGLFSFIDKFSLIRFFRIYIHFVSRCDRSLGVIYRLIRAVSRGVVYLVRSGLCIPCYHQCHRRITAQIAYGNRIIAAAVCLGLLEAAVIDIHRYKFALNRMCMFLSIRSAEHTRLVRYGVAVFLGDGRYLGIHLPHHIKIVVLIRTQIKALAADIAQILELFRSQQFCLILLPYRLGGGLYLYAGIDIYGYLLCLRSDLVLVVG